jgi:predicted secreted protein
MAKDKYRFSFYRAGGVDQVVLNSGADLAHLDELDQKLWLALSCPTRGLEFDSRTLDLVDTEKDGHIRPSEILGAVRFVRDACKNLDDLFKAEERVPLAAIKEDTELGKALAAEAKHILQSLGRPDAGTIGLDDVADTAKILTATRFNGDGILPPESAGDEPTAQAVRDLITALGSKPDRSGKAGIDQATVDKFFDETATYVAWLDKGEQDGATRLAGPGTAAAADALAAVRAKVDDYFARCRLAAYDGRAAVMLNPADATLVALSPKALSAESDEVASLPLATVGAGRALPLSEGLNPAWASRIAALATATLTPVLGAGKPGLSEADWTALKDRLAPYFAWQATKPATAVGALPAARLRELAAGDQRKQLTALIAEDLAAGDENQRVENVERLIRYRRDLVRLLRNFVNFAEFYGTRRAIFQAGTLFIDARSCDLCLPVEDAGKHASVAGLARAYLLYCDCTRKSGEKRTIVAAVTGGEVDNLMVGRNGVFCDRKGNDWDATVTRIVENPISIRQAFWSPYKSFVRMVEEQVAKRVSAADAEAKQKTQAAALSTAHADKTKTDGKPDAKPEPDDKKPEAKKIDVGTVAAIGVAVGGIATFLSSVLAMFFGLGVYMPLGFLGLLLAISGPAMLIAWLKLRQRNVGPILDANGWSVNALAKINVPFGAALTQVAALPRGSRRELRDPFAEKRRPWKLYIFLLVVIALGIGWYLGYLDAHLPIGVRVKTLLGA